MVKIKQVLVVNQEVGESTPADNAKWKKLFKSVTKAGGRIDTSRDNGSYPLKDWTEGGAIGASVINFLRTDERVAPTYLANENPVWKGKSSLSTASRQMKKQSPAQRMSKIRSMFQKNLGGGSSIMTLIRDMKTVPLNYHVRPHKKAAMVAMNRRGRGGGRGRRGPGGRGRIKYNTNPPKKKDPYRGQITNITNHFYAPEAGEMMSKSIHNIAGAMGANLNQMNNVVHDLHDRDSHAPLGLGLDSFLRRRGVNQFQQQQQQRTAPQPPMAPVVEEIITPSPTMYYRTPTPDFIRNIRKGHMPTPDSRLLRGADSYYERLMTTSPRPVRPIPMRSLMTPKVEVDIEGAFPRPQEYQGEGVTVKPHSLDSYLEDTEDEMSRIKKGTSKCVKLFLHRFITNYEESSGGQLVGSDDFNVMESEYIHPSDVLTRIKTIDGEHEAGARVNGKKLTTLLNFARTQKIALTDKKLNSLSHLASENYDSSQQDVIIAQGGDSLNGQIMALDTNPTLSLTEYNQRLTKLINEP